MLANFLQGLIDFSQWLQKAWRELKTPHLTFLSWKVKGDTERYGVVLPKRLSRNLKTQAVYLIAELYHSEGLEPPEEDEIYDVIISD